MKVQNSDKITHL